MGSNMKKISHWLNDSVYIPPLSPACKMCAQGTKMVILATGLCSTKCFYCPLSQKKSGTDCIFADEWELENENDTEKFIQEATYIAAKGAGITGGDPLLVWQRVVDYIQLLKNHFGPAFHIHLYTSGLHNNEHISDLVAAGLDEIRFHPQLVYWGKMEKNPLSAIIKKTMTLDCDVALEIPVFPSHEKNTLALITWADAQNLRWINLNELEFSETNYHALAKKGYSVKSDISAAVKSSESTALNILNEMKNREFDIGVHYCSVSFKDGIQLKNRIKRRAHHVAQAYDVITDDGTLLKGIILKEKCSSDELYDLLVTTFAIPPKYMKKDRQNNRVELAPWILEDIAAELHRKGYHCYLIEEYPTADRLEVERIPLPI
jgi:pyruvate formate-lyase activating enzyme-like uncharacterized protein